MFTNTPQQRNSNEPLGKKIALRGTGDSLFSTVIQHSFHVHRGNSKTFRSMREKKIPKARISVFEMISNTVKITNSSNSMQIKLEL